LWKVPLLIVVENNHIAQTTPTTLAMAGNIAGRLQAFDIPVTELDSCDVMEIHLNAMQMTRLVRREGRPYALVLNTARFGPHSKGDDTRAEAEIQALRSSRDPLLISGSRLAKDELERIQGETDEEVNGAFTRALADPPARLEEGG
jgi:TPP-dependent pyruvate/acetoin dehydrogenase alpha subunit